MSVSTPLVHESPEGKVTVDLPRAFKVRRQTGALDPSLMAEIVWAHGVMPMEGSLVFTTYKPVTLRDGKQAAMQCFSRIMAPGTWYDVEEEPIAPMPTDARAN